jgi:hypothetical protein
MCTWNQTRFKNRLQRFLNLKRSDKTRTLRIWKNLAQTRTRRTVTEISKCQNRTGGSLEKEEPQNAGDDWDPN